MSKLTSPISPSDRFYFPPFGGGFSVGFLIVHMLSILIDKRDRQKPVKLSKTKNFVCTKIIHFEMMKQNP